LSALLETLIGPEQRELFRLQQLWKMPRLEPYDLKNGILALKAKSSVWKHEAMLQKNTIVRECNRLLGRDAVCGIRVV
jgi:hypothetical protein